MAGVFNRDSFSHYFNLPDKRLLFNPLIDIESRHREESEMIEFYKMCNPYYSPEFGIAHILNKDIFPFQMSTIRAILRHKFPMLLLTRGGSKTFTLALFATYYAVMHPGARIILISGTFRQSKLIFQEIIRLYENSPLLQSITNKKPVIANDNCNFYVNNSSIIGLPLGAGDKIRGERGHVTIADEFDCLGYNSLLETELGIYRIGDLISNFNDRDAPVGVFTGDNNKKIEFPDKYIRTPKATDVYKIETVGGYNFKCSNKHQVMTNNGWKLAKDLSKDDYLIFENNYKFPSNFVSYKSILLDEDLAWAMGILTAEGAINTKTNIVCKMTDEKCVLKLQSILSKYTKNKISIYHRDAYVDNRGWNCKESFDLRLCDVAFRDLLEKFGLDRVKCYDKKIPYSILKSPRNIVVSYLSGLFQGDGSAFIFQDRDFYGKRLGISYYSVSEQLCSEVQTLLWKLDIFSTLRHRTTTGSNKHQWMVRLNGEYAINLFKELNIDLWNKKIDLSIVRNSWDRRHDGVTFCKERELRKDKTCWRGSIYRYGKIVSYSYFVTEEDAKKHAQYLKTIYPVGLKLKKVELLKDKEILYDLHLPKTHSFYANCFRQHNSINKEVFDVVIRGFGATQSDPWMKSREKLLSLKKRRSIPENVQSHASVMIPILDAAASGNKIVVSGTAGPRGRPLSKLYDQYTKILQSKVCGNLKDYRDVFGDEVVDDFDVDYKQYCIIKYTYMDLPVGMMDVGIIHNARATMSKMFFDMEYNCIFADDSLGFFKYKDIVGATQPKDGWTAVFRGRPGKKYVMGIDPARTIDRFAVALIELGEPAKVAYVWTSQGEKYSKSMSHVRQLLKDFDVVGIALDATGGTGVAVKDLFGDPAYLKEGEKPIVPYDLKPEEAPPESQRILYPVVFNPIWIEEANVLLQKAIEERTLQFPAENIVDKISDINEFKLKDDITDEINQAKKEIMSIEITYAANGSKRFNLKPPSMSADAGDAVVHKDRYSAILLANYLACKFGKIEGTDPDAIARAAYNNPAALGGYLEEFS